MSVRHCSKFRFSTHLNKTCACSMVHTRIPNLMRSACCLLTSWPWRTVSRGLAECLKQRQYFSGSGMGEAFCGLCWQLP